MFWIFDEKKKKKKKKKKTMIEYSKRITNSIR